MHAEKGVAAHLDTNRLAAHGHGPQHGHHIRTAQAQCQEVWSDYRFIHSIHRWFLSALESYLTGGSLATARDRHYISALESYLTGGSLAGASPAIPVSQTGCYISA